RHSDRRGESDADRDRLHRHEHDAWRDHSRRDGELMQGKAPDRLTRLEATVESLAVTVSELKSIVTSMAGRRTDWGMWGVVAILGLALIGYQYQQLENERAQREQADIIGRQDRLDLRDDMVENWKTEVAR